MLKWIKNSKSSKTNKTSKYRGVTLNYGKYSSSILLISYDRSKKRVVNKHIIGYFKTEKEAMEARVKFILEMF